MPDQRNGPLIDSSEEALEATKGQGLQEALDWYLCGVGRGCPNRRRIEAHADVDADTDTGPDTGPDKSNLAENCLLCNECGKLFSSVDFAQLHATKTGHEDFAETTEKVRQLTAEEKTQRLAELKEKLKEKRRQDAAKAEEEARKNELIRRKATKDMTEVRRDMEQKEAAKALQLRLKEKEEEKALRQRLRLQMAENQQRLRQKSEEQRRLAEGLPLDQPSPEPLHAESSHVETEQARLQIRLPDGKVLRECLVSSMTLAELVAHVEGKAGLPAGQHELMIPLPPRIFDVSREGDRTLASLDLCPSATMVFRQIVRK